MIERITKRITANELELSMATLIHLDGDKALWGLNKIEEKNVKIIQKKPRKLRKFRFCKELANTVMWCSAK